MKNQPAFPLQFTPHVNGEHHYGLNKLEYFSGLALQGLLSLNNKKEADNVNFTDFAYYAIMHAKELIKQLEKGA